MHSILLVEDTPECQLLVKNILHPYCEVSCAATASDAKVFMEKKKFDLIILDIILPDSDGFRLCTEFVNQKKETNQNVIFLSSKSDLTDKLMGFNLGALDYIVKPFEPLELRARVFAKLKSIESDKQKNQILNFSNIRLILPYMKAFIVNQNKEIDLQLTPIEFKILYLLAKNKNQVFSRSRILEKVWGDDVYVSERTVDTHIYTLRKKLNTEESLIVSIPGEGYRLEA
jgi:DNA-binding response OmpR family regulator